MLFYFLVLVVPATGTVQYSRGAEVQCSTVVETPCMEERRRMG